MRLAPVAIRALLIAVLGLVLPLGGASAAVRSATGMSTPRALHTATALPAAGGSTATVVVAGGLDATGATLATAERYDPTTDRWTAVDPMATPRRGHSAVALPPSTTPGGPNRPQGGVFVIGGLDPAGDPVTTAEILDLATGTWTTAFVRTPGLVGEQVVGIGERVVVTGGVNGNGAVVQAVQTYDTGAGGVITSTMLGPRTNHAATALADGRVLVTGGYDVATPGATALASAEILNAAGNAWTPATPLPAPRAEHTASLVDAGRVLLAGGAAAAGGAPLSTSDVFAPASNLWASGGAMPVARIGHEATVVREGWVALTGGTNPTAPDGLDAADSWTPDRGWLGLYGLPGPEPIGGARRLHAAAAIPQTDEILITGGGAPASASVVRYTPERPPVPTPTPAPTPGPTPTPTPLQQPTGPIPVQGVSVTVTPVSGTVFVRVGTGSEYRELKAGEAVPVGTVLDTTDGRIRLSAAVGGARQSALFYGGTFQVTQPRGQGGLVELRLIGKPVCKTKATAAVKRKAKPRLWGDGEGKFRTRGANSSATVRGTRWLVEERCAGTFTRVARGRVAVRDFSKRVTVQLRAPRSYLARPR